MGVEVKTTKAGDTVNKPKLGDIVRLWYKGCIYDKEMPKGMGRQ